MSILEGGKSRSTMAFAISTESNTFIGLPQKQQHIHVN